VSDRLRALEIASGGDAVVVWAGNDELVLAAKHPTTRDYPTLCVSRSDYLGSAMNVIPVPSFPLKPQKIKTFPTVKAPNPTIQAILSQTLANDLLSLDTTLQNFFTRHSQSSQANDSVNWVKNYLEGYGWSVQLQNFRTGYCPNVIATRPGVGRTGRVTLAGAHLDDRQQQSGNATARAPGADDNGTGSVLLLNFAKLIATNDVQFENDLVLAWFCGEEQGLYGSAFMASDYASRGVNIIGMYNVDMLGYDCGQNTLAMVVRQTNLPFTDACRAVISVYLPNLATGSSTACCSDQQSFHTQGYPATGFFECPGTGVAYPNYHTDGDTVDKLNFSQVAYFGQGFEACVMETAVVALTKPTATTV